MICGSFSDIVRDSIMNDIILNNDKYEVALVQGSIKKKKWEKLNKEW